jgi:hypothetical protein
VVLLGMKSSTSTAVEIPVLVYGTVISIVKSSPRTMVCPEEPGVWFVHHKRLTQKPVQIISTSLSVESTVFNEDTKLGIPQGFRKRLHFRFVIGFEEDTNPIEKTEVVVYSSGTTLRIDPVARALGDDGNPVVNATNIPARTSKQYWRKVTQLGHRFQRY